MEAPEASERPARAPRSSESAARSDAAAPAAPTPEPAPAVVGTSPASAPTVAAPVPVPAVPPCPGAPDAAPRRSSRRHPSPADLPTVRTARPPLPPPPAPARPVAADERRARGARPPRPRAAQRGGPGVAAARVRRHLRGPRRGGRLPAVAVRLHHVGADAAGVRRRVLDRDDPGLRPRLGRHLVVRGRRPPDRRARPRRRRRSSTPAAQAGDQNFLVVGSDTRVGAAPDEDVGDSSRRAGRALGHRHGRPRAGRPVPDHRRLVPPRPRDRPALVRALGLGLRRPTPARRSTATARVKLNTAYQVGGPRCVTKVVQELSGLAVNHFLGVDFSGFKDMVDAVDGVPVCLEKPLRDSVLGTVVDRAGTSVLTGDQALNFVRARHVVGDPTSDYGRIHRQQVFLSALLRQTLSAGTLLDLGRLRGPRRRRRPLDVRREHRGRAAPRPRAVALGPRPAQRHLHDGAHHRRRERPRQRGAPPGREPRALRRRHQRPAAARPARLRAGHRARGAGPGRAGRAAARRRPHHRHLGRARGTGASAGRPGPGATGPPGRRRGVDGDDGASGGSGSGDPARDRVPTTTRPGSAAPPPPSRRRARRRARWRAPCGATASRSAADGVGAAADRTVIRFSPDQAGAAATLQKAVPGAVLDPARAARRSSPWSSPTTSTAAWSTRPPRRRPPRCRRWSPRPTPPAVTLSTERGVTSAFTPGSCGRRVGDRASA